MSFDVRMELLAYLNSEADLRRARARSRRSSAASVVSASRAERRSAHALAEKMAGRKLAKTSREDDLAAAEMQERIAANLDTEADMLLRFAAFVAALSKEFSA